MYLFEGFLKGLLFWSLFWRSLHLEEAQTMSSVLNGVHCVCVFYLEFISTNCFSNFQDKFELDPVLKSIWSLRVWSPYHLQLFKIIFSGLSVSRNVQCRAMFDISGPYKSSSVGSVWLFKWFFTYLTVTFCLVHVSSELLMLSYRTNTLLDSKNVPSAVSWLSGRRKERYCFDIFRSWQDYFYHLSYCPIHSF